MKKLKNEFSDIPRYIAEWTDKYFHQSAFDVPVDYPSQKIVTFLLQFKKERAVKLFRGINKYNVDNTKITSWTYDHKTAERYAKETGGNVVEKLFSPSQILLDTTLLTDKRKKELGYDYKIDDKEVVIMTK